MRKLFLTMAVCTATTPAYAYLGPGMGAGTIAVTLGIIGSIFLALFAVIYYPFKRMLKRRKAREDLEHKHGEKAEQVTTDPQSKVENSK